MDMSILDAALRPYARAMLLEILTPMFATPEQRAAAQAEVDALTDDEIQQKFAHAADLEEAERIARHDFIRRVFDEWRAGQPPLDVEDEALWIALRPRDED